MLPVAFTWAVITEGRKASAAMRTMTVRVNLFGMLLMLLSISESICPGAQGRTPAGPGLLYGLMDKSSFNDTSPLWKNDGYSLICGSDAAAPLRRNRKPVRLRAYFHENKTIPLRICASPPSAARRAAGRGGARGGFRETCPPGGGGAGQRRERLTPLLQPPRICSAGLPRARRAKASRNRSA